MPEMTISETPILKTFWEGEGGGTLKQTHMTSIWGSHTWCLCDRYQQGARKDGCGNEPVGSCAMCDAQSTGPRALKGKKS